MRRHLFLRVVNGVQAASDYFVDGPDATGRGSFTSLHKCTMAIRMLAYGDSADRIDEYLRVGESTARECFEYFTNAVISHFRNEYLRIPTVEDTQRLLQIGASRGFSGMLGSIDCMHWKWKNCPNAWKGQFQGRNSSPTVILEAVASQDLWIWHSYFGTPGSANDLNVLNRSPVFDALLNGYVPNVNYMVNGNQYDCGYYLTDGIYPKWATFIQSIRHPQTPKDRLFATKQESVRKDVERAFGVLQARFAVIRNPARYWSKEFLHKVMTTCIILHNMIVEDERESYIGYNNIHEYIDNHIDDEELSVDAPTFEIGYIANIHQFVANRNVMQDPRRHQALKKDLVEHIWQQFG
ncbi:uncharacterized protein LOC141652346 [Silene latifolia]|uniref:uncharacterized protein LOC141652346 n=1 Tax=Silene latifolia TaxID=37657 RepID=UPI003D7863DB